MDILLTDEKSGIYAIAQERLEQLDKHGRTIGYDFTANSLNQLSIAAARLVDQTVNDEFRAMNYRPRGWDQILWAKMAHKSYKERLIIAGVLLAAEYDRCRAATATPVELPTELDPDLTSTQNNEDQI